MMIILYMCEMKCWWEFYLAVSPTKKKSKSGILCQGFFQLRVIEHVQNEILYWGFF